MLTLGPCVVVAVLLQFFFISSFSWMTVMSLDLCQSFLSLNAGRSRRRLSRTGSGLRRSKDTARFVVYSAVGWGVPGVISATTVLLNFDLLPGVASMKPRFGENSCWFSGDLQIFIYFYGPIGMMLLINLITFLVTVCGITG